MFKTTFFSVFFFISTALAATPVYLLSLDLTLNGKKVASQGLTATSGKKSEITQKSSEGAQSFIEVTPEQIKEEAGKIHLKFVVGIIEKNGERRILSAPEMIVTEGKQASITVGEDDGPESLTLSVMAQRSASRR
jgi:hypothetical protein